MCLLLETIKLEDGKLCNLYYHNQRYNKARRELFSMPEVDLTDLIKIPEEYTSGIFRCRVTYQKQIEKIEFIPHQPREIKSLQIVHDDNIDYSHKYADRLRLQELYNQRGNADEIIIVKKGLVTDCYIGNLVFFDDKKWWTPNSPLLKGTQRQRLLDEGKIHETSITEHNIADYQSVGIINVFYDLQNMPIINTKQISH